MDIPEISSALLAGFLQGEGCFHIGKRKDKPREFNPSISVAQRELQTLKFFQSLTESGNIYYRPENAPIRGRPGKPIYRWSISQREDLIKILNAVLPYLVGRCRRKAELVLEMTITKRNHHQKGQTRRLSNSIILERQGIYQRFLEANRRTYG